MTRRSVWWVVVAMALVPIAFAVAPARPAAAADGLRVTSTTTYTVDPVAGVVHVLAEMTFTNTVPDHRDGNVIRRAYFTGFTLPAPVGAIGPAAVTASNGRALTLTPEIVPGNGDFFLLNVNFASNLFSNQTTRINVTYDITGLPPRTENPSRVNAAYAAFDAFGIGDDGRVTVRVVVPAGFEIDTFGADATRTVEDGNTVYTASDIPNPQEFDLFISARSDAGLTSREVTTPEGDRFELRAWPGDDEWVAFVETQVQTGVPKLAEIIGRPWPIDGTIEVREAYTPYLYGYAGWFSASRQEIEIGEELDQEVVLHELSHAWFSDNWFRDRWLNEGYAQTYSNLAIEALGGEAGAPEPIDDDDPFAVTLNEWGDPLFREGADAVEAYGYNASWSVVKAITDDIGLDAARKVLAAVDDGTIAYVGDGEAEPAGIDTDWRRYLDLVDEIGGSTVADDLIEQYVVTPNQAAGLDDRAAARDLYHRLAERSGEWAPPLVLRQKMSRWSFVAATELMLAADEVLDLRDELAARSAELDVTPPGDVEAVYEGETKDLTATHAELDDQLDATEAVIAAVAAEAADRGLIDRVGLIGTDLPAQLDDAKAALAAGDTDLARATAAAVEQRLGRADEIGTQRAGIAGGAAVAFLVLVVTVVLLLRRRRRRRRAALAAEPTTGDDAVSTDEPDIAPAGIAAADIAPIDADPALADPPDTEPREPAAPDPD